MPLARWFRSRPARPGRAGRRGDARPRHRPPRSRRARRDARSSPAPPRPAAASSGTTAGGCRSGRATPRTARGARDARAAAIRPAGIERRARAAAGPGVAAATALVDTAHAVDRDLLDKGLLDHRLLGSADWVSGVLAIGCSSIVWRIRAEPTLKTRAARDKPRPPSGGAGPTRWKGADPADGGRARIADDRAAAASDRPRRSGERRPGRRVPPRRRWPRSGSCTCPRPSRWRWPANGHYAGRTDLLAARCSTRRGSASRCGWEDDGEPSMRFPHAYGPVPTAAVLDVLPTRPSTASSSTDAPADGPGGPGARAFRSRSCGGWRPPPCPSRAGWRCAPRPCRSPTSTTPLFLDAPVDAATVVAEADRALVGLDHRAVALFGDALADTAIALGRGAGRSTRRRA